MRGARQRAFWGWAVVAGLATAAFAAPKKPAVVVVLGEASEVERLADAVEAARVATLGASQGVFPDGVVVQPVAAPDDTAGWKQALRKLRAAKPVGVIALPPAEVAPRWWKSARGIKVPWISVTGVPPSGLDNPGHWLHVGASAEAVAVELSDRLVAPLAARRVGVVHEPGDLGIRIAAGVARNLSPSAKLAGIREWPAEPTDSTLNALRAFEADWIVVALQGRRARELAGLLAKSDWRPRLLFTDGARDEALLQAAQGALEGCTFLDAPDPELQGRLGEQLLDGWERGDRPWAAVVARAFEAARLILLGVEKAEGRRKLSKVWPALDPTTPAVGTFGKFAFGPHGRIERFPFSFWRVHKGSYQMWPADLFPTEGCGPPIGFGRPPRPPVHERGKIGYLHFSEGEKRTIQDDLAACGLHTKGKAPEVDKIIEDELLARAMRVAHQLFRREPDGSPIPGWSWGMALTAKPPGDDISRGRIWPAVIAGDDPGAGGRAFGSWVQVYTTFLKRTMYEQHALETPVSAADLELLDGTYRWGEDKNRNRRLDDIRCLIDGFASAVGLTLAHEYGHCCGCGHDTEHPTSIMNVVAGAGKSWEAAVWIPSHQRKVTNTLGFDVVHEDEDW